jgi:quinohemoprotein ethanol dehydrogenase
MKRLWVPLAAIALGVAVAGCGSSGSSSSPAFKPDELSAHGGDNWLTTGGGLTDDRYSTLKDIDRSNVSKLKVAWHIHLGIPKKISSRISEEASPIAYKGTLYVPDGRSNVYALDGASGKLLWKYSAGQSLKSVVLATNRGVAIGDGRIYEGLLDGNVVALDQKTGRVLWKRQVGFLKDGYTFTSAPVYFDGMVVEGVSGGDLGARSFALALDAKTGRELWRWYVVPGPGELGSGSWDGVEWMHGGGAIWVYPSIDSQRRLVYIVTGNPVPWNGRGLGDNLWTDSIVALHVDNGQFAWGYQTVHHDIWDYDVTNPPVMFDATINGRLRHGIAIASKTSWDYILDRQTGQPLLSIPEKKVPKLKGAGADYANTSPTQPFPAGQPFANQCTTRAAWPKPAPDGHPFRVGCIFSPYAPTKQGSYLASAPSASGGVDWPPSAYNPETHLHYLCVHDGAGGALGAIPHSQQKLVVGQLYVGVNFGAGSPVRKDFGRVVAMDVTTNRIAWDVKWPVPCYSGTLTTAGGLVFAGQSERKAGPTSNASKGVLTAFDASTGRVLWNSPHLDAGPNAPAMTYTAKGKQYAVVLTGGNSLVAASKPGDSVYAFALP